MTSNNPFAAALADAAREGYLVQRRERRDDMRAYARKPDMQFAAPVAEGASDRQLDYIADLMANRDFTAETRPKYLGRVAELADANVRAQLSRQAASAFIEYLLSLPKITRTALSAAPVPVGRYAVEVGDTLAFVQVDRPEEGRWAGYTFVTRQIADEFVRVSRQQATVILNAIAAAGPAEASKRYGREIGECGVCHRTLTSEDSRAAGIGPVCAAKSGW